MAAQQRKIGLGKGLSALLDDSEEVNQRSADNKGVGDVKEQRVPAGISPIAISQIVVNPFQPRTDFDEEALRELADSIKLQGLIQPITVRQAERGTYQLISGERRLRAAKLAGLAEIPAYVRTANDQQMLEMALIENIQREKIGRTW